MSPSTDNLKIEFKIQWFVTMIWQYPKLVYYSMIYWGYGFRKQLKNNDLVHDNASAKWIIPTFTATECTIFRQPNYSSIETASAVFWVLRVHIHIVQVHLHIYVIPIDRPGSIPFVSQNIKCWNVSQLNDIKGDSLCLLFHFVNISRSFMPHNMTQPTVSFIRFFFLCLSYSIFCSTYISNRRKKSEQRTIIIKNPLTIKKNQLINYTKFVVMCLTYPNVLKRTQDVTFNNINIYLIQKNSKL